MGKNNGKGKKKPGARFPSPQGDFSRRDERPPPPHSHFHQSTMSQRSLRPSEPRGRQPQAGNRNQSNAIPDNRFAGILRHRDNCNPSLNQKYRGLKVQSERLKLQLEEMISVIDELQPDPSAMDWAATTATIVYVQVPEKANEGSRIPVVEVANANAAMYPNYPNKALQEAGKGCDAVVMESLARWQQGTGLGNEPSNNYQPPGGATGNSMTPPRTPPGQVVRCRSL